MFYSSLLRYNGATYIAQIFLIDQVLDKYIKQINVQSRSEFQFSCLNLAVYRYFKEIM